jgi:putative signal transducing protein
MEDLVVLQVVQSGAEAEMIRGLLQTADIPSLARQTSAGAGMAGGLPGGAGAHEILVPEDRLADARRLLEEQAG